MQSHGSLISNARALVTPGVHAGGPPAPRPARLSRTRAFVGIGCTLMSGASMVYLPRFDADDVVTHLPDCTQMMGVPTPIPGCSPHRYSPQSAAGTRVFIPLRAAAARDLRELRATDRTAHPRTLRHDRDRHEQLQPSTNDARAVGPPLPGVRIRIVDDAGREAPPDTVGHIEPPDPTSSSATGTARRKRRKRSLPTAGSVPAIRQPLSRRLSFHRAAARTRSSPAD